MKKFFSLLLCAAMMLSLFAGCGGNGNAETTGGAALEGFCVGYGSVIASPTESVPLGGYNDSLDRWSTGVENPFEVICVAFTDEDGETLLYITLDLLLVYGFASPLRAKVSEATGIPENRIMIHCDHNHSGPDMLLQEQPSIARYTDEVYTAAAEAATAALADRKPAQMFTTFCRPEKHNTVRHYLLADGNFQAEGVGAVAKDQIIGHATQVDNLLQLVKFTREGGKDVVMVNWQGHPPGTDPRTMATGNYYSVLRRYLRENLNCEAVFVLGGSGNVNNSSQIPGEVKHDTYVELGEALGAEAVKAAANFTPAETGKLLFYENDYTLQSNSGNSTVPLRAFSIGDFAMAMAPFEIFDTNARGVREASKFKMTFYSSCTNGSKGYLPTPMSFDWEIAYEVRITKYPKGTAEIVQEQLTLMLDDLFTKSGISEVKDKGEGYNQVPQEPATDGVTYIIMRGGAGGDYKAVANGFFALSAVTPDAKIRNLLTRDEEMAKKILEHETAQLIFDYQGVVVGIVE